MKKLLIALLVLIAAYLVGAVVLAVANGQAEGKVLNADKQILTDGDMEASDTSAWTAVNTTPTKEAGGVEDGKRILKLTRDASGAYVYQSVLTIGKTYKLDVWARGDGANNYPMAYIGVAGAVGTTSTEWQHLTVIGVAEFGSVKFYAAGPSGYSEFDNAYVTEYIGKQTNAESQMLADGDMEESDTSSWLFSQSILTKESGAAVDGARILRITNDGATPYAYQPNITSGTDYKTYRATGWARGDGTANPVITLCNQMLLSGTVSTDWQRFDAVVHCKTLGTRRLWIYTVGGSPGNYAEFDDIFVTEYTAPTTQNYVALFTDGDMEAADTSAWSELGSASVTKESAIRDDGLLALRVTSSGSGSPGTHQDVFVVGQRYRMTGWTRTDSSRTVQIGDRSLAGGCASLPSTGTSWTHFDCTFTAGHVGARLGFASTGASQWAEFDDVLATAL